MRVAFLYNDFSEDPAHIEEENVPCHSAVVESLKRLGHEVIAIACTLDLTAARDSLQRAQPDVAFNRVESIGGSDAMMAALTLLLDRLQIPYTGCPTAVLVATANKLTVKQRLVRAGLPTPAWVTTDGAYHAMQPVSAAGQRPVIRKTRYILKSVLEHASFRMEDDAVVGPLAAAELPALLREREAETGRPYFAETYIAGREFNLSLMGESSIAGAEPRVLPPAEIDFSTFPAGKLRIVGHQAKYNTDSFEHENTPRRFDFPAADQPLLEKLTELARKCWHVFDLGGYVRVDFRCDAHEQPWILEINSNPCVLPESGFAGALEQVNIGYDAAIERILKIALPEDSPKPRRKTPTPATTPA